MPILESSFSPPFSLRSATVQTAVPAMLRRLAHIDSAAEPLELSDGDFLELEWFPAQSPERRQELVILSHGLEGSTKSGYIRGLAYALTHNGFDVLAWNMRGCGSHRNKLVSWYHSGQTYDLKSVIELAVRRYPATPISLVGISVGGNIVCKYLGEEGKGLPRAVTKAIVVSVPLDLRSSAETLAKPSRTHYMRYLLRPLRQRIREKAALFPGHFDLRHLDSISTFHEFDSRYTAPMHGFSSVDEYWDSCSGIHFLERSSVPVLIITARDDPFLGPNCYPTALATRSDTIFLETPAHGGHVGFIDSWNLKVTWLDERIVKGLLTSW